MDLTTAGFIISVLGFVLAVIVAIPTIRKWVNSRTPTMFLVLDENINLYNQISKGIDGLNITYHNMPINDKSYLLKAFVCYIGKKDITKESIKTPISINLPLYSEILSHRVLYRSNDLDVTTRSEANKLIFNIDLIKNKKYVYFEAFINVETNDIKDIYKLSSRITDVSNFDTISYQTINNKFWNNILNFQTVTMIWFFFTTIADSYNYKSIKEKIYDFDKIFYYNNIRISSDSLYSEMENVEQIFKKDNYLNELKSVSKDSLSRLQSHLINLLNFAKAEDHANSILNAALAEKPDWRKLKTYNIFRLPQSKTEMVTLKDGYTVQFSYKHHWFNLIFFVISIIYFIFMITVFINIQRQQKTKPVLDLIFLHKKNNIGNDNLT